MRIQIQKRKRQIVRKTIFLEKKRSRKRMILKGMKSQRKTIFLEKKLSRKRMILLRKMLNQGKNLPGRTLILNQFRKEEEPDCLKK